MPLVFVHGVNTRQSAEYDAEVIARDALFRQYLLPSLKGDPDKVQIFNPYWGKEASKFPWNCGFAHDTQPNLESFGPNSEVLDHALDSAQVAPTPSVQNDVIVSLAKRDFSAAVDLLWVAAGLSSQLTNQQAIDLAGVSLAVNAYVATQHGKVPQWVYGVQSDAEFAEKLVDEVEGEAKRLKDTSSEAKKGLESFGTASDLLDTLKRGAFNVAERTADAGFGRFAERKLPNLVRRFSVFFGDVFEYIKQSYSPPNRIAAIVEQELRKAGEIAEKEKEPLVCVGHSMGGNILYDLYTSSTKASLPRCNLFVTVGSQVGLFEELKLFHSSDPKFPPNATTQVPATRHPLLTQWINIFDRSDPFGYPASTIFQGVTDFAFDTEVSSLSAHSGYFLQPRFHDKLRKRLIQFIAR